MLNKHRKYAFAVATALTTMLLAGCKDDNYDLSDINTDMQLTIDNLTLPLNLAPIEFDDMVDLTDEECIEVVNGEYVLIKRGTYASEEIKINDIHADAEIGSFPSGQHVPAFVATPIPLNEAVFPFSYTYGNVDEYIVDIESGQVDLNIQIRLTTKTDNGSGVPCKFENLVFELPKGFYGEASNGQNFPYNDNDDKDHLVEIKEAYTDADGEYVFNYHVTSFNFKNTGASLTENNDGSNKKRFHLGADITLKSGTFQAVNTTNAAGNIGFDFAITKLEVNNFTGTVYYDLKELDPEEIQLDDLPDVLTDEQTNLSLRNPQLYLELENPLESYGVSASTGLDIVQVRPSGEPVVDAYLVDKQGQRSRMDIAAAAGKQYFCLSPVKPGSYYEGFGASKHYTMKNLGNIISGKGLPEGLRIAFETPRMDERRVVNFPLGVNHGTVGGDYVFFAPLALGNGSHIYYTEEATGWGLSSDTDDLNITRLTIKADVISELPVNVTLWANPLDVDGNYIRNDDGSIYQTNKVHVVSGQRSPIELTLDGNIKGLDGMRYYVTLDAGENAGALSPTQHLNLTNLKVVVSGSYVITDDDDDDDYDYDYDDYDE